MSVEGSLGRDSPWERRKPDLPTDMECAGCDAVIEDGDRCYRPRAGYNRKGEFDKVDGRQSTVLCPGCVADV